MPIFRSNYDIFVNPESEEVFDPNWMDSDTLILPPKKDWDYSRELQIEDVDIWEVIFENCNRVFLYASWLPYAEYYLMIVNLPNSKKEITTFYGAGAQKRLLNELKKYGINPTLNKVWVDEDKINLYE